MDPSSTFFDGPRAYLPNISAAREAEADAFTANLSEDLSDSQCSSRTVVQDNRAARQRASDEICIGIPSIKRNKEQFLRRTVASLFDTLESDERKTIYLAVLIADDHAEDNPAYGQDWLGCLADEIMVYSEPSLPSGLLNYRRILSPGHNHEMDRNEHVRHDYANLIEACQRRGSPFFTLIEDDTIASRSWLRRLRQGLIEAEEHNSNRDWLYIRLFYSETYLGWNNEEIPIYIRNIIFIYVSLGIILSALDFLRSLSSAGVHNGFHPQHHVKAHILVYFWTTAFISLYFAAGRLLVNPYKPGLQEMPDYGCCAQGLAFPERHYNLLTTSLRRPPYILPGDSTIEEIANQFNLRKLALVPSVLQHVGKRGSSALGGAVKHTWNFRFERQY
ncbi:hypothetical protein S40293_02279 [Stachybotrys chartarum IBT 40293]|nr:hypothetical protein S40293_02279 [Stachybotrys chartarum IBT 40293]